MDTPLIAETTTVELPAPRPMATGFDPMTKLHTVDPADVVLDLSWRSLAEAGIALIEFACAQQNPVAQVNALLRAVGAVDQQQSRLLKSIDNKLARLIKAPFEAGRHFLLQSGRYGHDIARRTDALEKANDRFVDALVLAANPGSASTVQLNLGITAELRGHRNDAQWYYEQAYDGAARAAHDLLAPIDKVGWGSPSGTGKVAETVGRALESTEHALKGFIVNKSRRTIEDLLSFTNCVACLLDAGGSTSSERRPLKLAELRPGEWAIIPAPPSATRAGFATTIVMPAVTAAAPLPGTVTAELVIDVAALEAMASDARETQPRVAAPVSPRRAFTNYALPRTEPSE